MCKEGAPEAHVIRQDGAALAGLAQAHDALVQEGNALALVRSQVLAQVGVHHDRHHAALLHEHAQRHSEHAWLHALCFL
jgi:hypothetical protein